MRKIVDYKVIEGCGLGDLNDTVSIAVHEGWQPLGAAFQSDKMGDKIYYAQTMVKYEEVQK